MREIPKKYQKMVGTRKILSGGLFNYNRAEPEAEYDILDIRVGMAHSIVFKPGTHQIAKKHPTFELLIKNENMKRSRWTHPFPIREITLKD